MRCPKGTLLLPDFNLCVCRKIDEVFNEDSWCCEKCERNEISEVFKKVILNSGEGVPKDDDLGLVFKKVYH